MMQYDWCPYEKGKFCHRLTHREKLCEDEGRNWGDVSVSQRIPKIASKPLKAGEEAWDTVFLADSGGTSPAGMVLSDFGPPEGGRVEFYCLSPFVTAAQGHKFTGTPLQRHN